jgi:hypothetical protein
MLFCSKDHFTHNRHITKSASAPLQPHCHGIMFAMATGKLNHLEGGVEDTSYS